MSEQQEIATASQTLNIGSELKNELERVAREQGLDATGLARRLLREYVAELGASEKAADGPT